MKEERLKSFADLKLQSTKNILILPMSTFAQPKKNEKGESVGYIELNPTKYSTPENNKEIITNGYQLEPVPKYLKDKDGLDCVLLINTKATESVAQFPIRVVDSNGKVIKEMNTSPDAYMEEYLKGLDKDIDIKRYCLSESNKATQKDIDHIIGIIKEYAKDNSYNIRIFVDMHGGFRTNVEMMSIIFSLLPLELAKPSEDGYAHEPIQINADDIYSVTFGGGNNEIIPAGDGYRLLDLVSGIHEFVQYGRVDSLNRYVKNDGNMEYYVTAMRDMADGISMGNIQLFEQGLEGFRSGLEGLESISTDTTTLLVELLKQEYDKILKDNDIRNLIEWSMSKQFYQFATTVCAEKVIPFLEENNIFDFSELAPDTLNDYQRAQRINFYIKNQNSVVFEDIHFFGCKKHFNDSRDKDIQDNYYFICLKDNDDIELLNTFLTEHRRIKNTRDTASHIGEEDTEKYEDVKLLKEGIERYIKCLDKIIYKKLSFKVQYVRKYEKYKTFRNRYKDAIITPNIYYDYIAWLKKPYENKYKVFHSTYKNIFDSRFIQPLNDNNTERVPFKEPVKTPVENTIIADVKPLEKVEEVVKKQPPHWIHHTKEDPRLIGGVIYLPSCDCSECGFTVNLEKKKCPHCGAVIWK